MPTIKRFAPWLRAVFILSAVGLIVGRVTFAALQSQQAILSGNTIQSATAALQLSNDGTTFANSVQGFTFNGLIPGGSAMPTENGGKSLWLKNSGSATLSIKALVSSPPTVTGDLDLSKVFVVITPVTGGSPQTVSILALQTAASHNGTLLNLPTISGGSITEYRVQISMAADAFSSSSASIQGLNIIFLGGVYVQNPGTSNPEVL